MQLWTFEYEMRADFNLIQTDFFFVKLENRILLLVQQQMLKNGEIFIS